MKIHWRKPPGWQRSYVFPNGRAAVLTHVSGPFPEHMDPTCCWEVEASVRPGGWVRLAYFPSYRKARKYIRDFGAARVTRPATPKRSR